MNAQEFFQFFAKHLIFFSLPILDSYFTSPKRKKVSKTVPGPSSINLRYTDESELLDRSKVVRKSNKVRYVQNRRLLNKVENYEKI